MRELGRIFPCLKSLSLELKSKASSRVADMGGFVDAIVESFPR